MIYFHGTNKSSANQIIERGFDIEATRTHDPGDLGWGIYFSSDYYRAKSYGQYVIAVELSKKVKLAQIINPYFLLNLERVPPVTLEEILFYNIAFDENGNMRNVYHGISEEEKILISTQIRYAFLKAGYDGILAGPFNPRRTDKELVIFNPNIIESIYQTNME